MIYEINWKLDGRLPFHYIKNIPYFKKHNKIEFKQGLNLIVGNNGCGKSTIINLIKFYFLETHGNLPEFNCDEYDNLALKPDGVDFVNGVNVVASYGTPTISMNNHMELSSTHRISVTSIDFHMNRGSQGEMSMQEYNRCVSTMYDNNSSYRHPYSLIDKSINDDKWKEDVKQYYKDNDIRDRIPTMVMDEPDNSVSILHILDFQKELDELINNCSDGMQVIMVLHNPILLMHFIDNPKVNFIEMTKGYIDAIKKLKYDS